MSANGRFMNGGARAMRQTGRWLAVMTVMAIGLYAGPARAVIPEPHFILYGTATIDGQPGATGRVTLQLSGQGEEIAASELTPGEPGRYVLRVPMDSEGSRAAGTARVYDYAEVFVNGVKATGVVIGERGTYSELDISVATLHEIRFVGEPSALPNPAAAGSRVQVAAAAVDSFGHTVSYRWEALCPGLPSQGSFENAGASSTFWTAPENITGLDTACALRVTAQDAGGTSGWRTVGVTVRPQPHTLTIVAGPAGTPNPAASGAEVSLVVTARDGFGHVLTYTWSANCPGLDPAGLFSGSGPSVSWTAPVNASDDALECTIAVEAADGTGASARGTLSQVVLSATHRILFSAAAAGAPNPVIGGRTVAMSALAEDTRTHALSYSWSAVCSGTGGGSFQDATERTPVWTAPEIPTGAHAFCVVQATVTDSRGAVARSSYVQEVRGGSPVAVPQVAAESVLCPGPISLDGSGSYHENPGRRIVSYEWDFDYDGTRFDSAAAGVTAEVRYGQVGAYTAALRVSDDSSPALRSVGTVEVTVGGAAPVANAGGAYTIATGDPLRLDGSSSRTPGTACGNRIVSYDWELGDDGTFDDALGARPVLRWDEVETLVCGGLCATGEVYPLALRVTDALGQEHTATTTLWIDALDRQVKVVAPNGGEMLGCGQDVALRWVSDAAVQDVRLLLSTGNPPGWQELLETAAPDGTKLWRVPTQPEQTLRDCRMKAVGLVNGSEVAADESDGPFALGAVDVIYPEAGTVLAGGERTTVRWQKFATARAVRRALIRYTLDGGTTWRTAGEAVGQAGEFSWQVPAIAQNRDRCMVMVQLRDSRGRLVGSDTSEGFFTIRGKVDLTTPEGGEQIFGGTTRFVRWESGQIRGVASALLKLTTDGGRSWRTIGTIRGNPGVYSWSVPATEEPLESCRVRVQLRNAARAVVASDDGAGLFTILPLP